MFIDMFELCGDRTRDLQRISHVFIPLRQIGRINKLYEEEKNTLHGTVISDIFHSHILRKLSMSK
jgi:hypothetical protein